MHRDSGEVIMNILMLTWDSFGNKDIEEAFVELGHRVTGCPFSDEEGAGSEEAVRRLTGKLQETAPDFVFSFNYYPVAATACKNLGIPYVAWVYDSPYVRLYHYTVIYPTNHIFVFDRAVYLEFHRAGVPTVYYLPMAANAERLSGMTDFETFRQTEWANRHEVAFVGSLYTEKHQFYQRLTGISDYTRGYLEGLMNAQRQVYGYNFIQELLNKEIISDMRRSLPMQVLPGGAESIEYLFAQYVINRQLTAMERLELLTDVAAGFGLDLYTPDKGVRLEGAVNHGVADFYDCAPYVFKNAKINLNITLRSIQSGIPLRAFEIMGAGGFLLTNYQADFMDFFVPGEDFVYYESRRDLMDKIAYYLGHEEERAQIAENGFGKVAARHTYRHRAEEMISYL